MRPMLKVAVYVSLLLAGITPVTWWWLEGGTAPWNQTARSLPSVASNSDTAAAEGPYVGSNDLSDDGVSGRPKGDFPPVVYMNEGNAARLHAEYVRAIALQGQGLQALCPLSAAFRMGYGPRPSEGPQWIGLQIKTITIAATPPRIPYARDYYSTVDVKEEGCSSPVVRQVFVTPVYQFQPVQFQQDPRYVQASVVQFQHTQQQRQRFIRNQAYQQQQFTGISSLFRSSLFP